jgi:hypothetical protein
MTSKRRPIALSTVLTDPPSADVPHRTRQVGPRSRDEHPPAGELPDGDGDFEEDGAGEGDGLLLPPHAASTPARAPAAARRAHLRTRLGRCLVTGNATSSAR